MTYTVNVVAQLNHLLLDSSSISFAEVKLEKGQAGSKAKLRRGEKV